MNGKRRFKLFSPQHLTKTRRSILDSIEQLIIFDEHIMRIEERVANELESVHANVVENWC